MEKLNPVRSYLHFFLDAPRCTSAWLQFGGDKPDAWRARVGPGAGGLLKDVSPYSSVFRRVIPKYRDGTKGVFKASKTFIGQSNSGIKILPLEAVMGSLLCITLPCMFIRWIKIQSRFQMPFALPATASPSSCNWISKTWKVLQRCLRLVLCVVIKTLTVAIQD